VFSDLYNLIKEDEIETEYKTDKNVISNKKDNKKDNKNVISNKKDNNIKDNNKKDNKNVISNKKDNNKKDNIKKDNIKKDNKNVISNEIDDKPKQVNSLEQINVLDGKIKPFNLLDLRPDILNIVGDFVKRREIKELMDEEQIINGKTIKIGTFIMTCFIKPLNTKEDLKKKIFHCIDIDFQEIKKYAKKRRVRLINDDMRKCFLILFKRYKILLDINKGYYNKDVYNMDDDDEKEFFEEYLKLNKLNSPQKFEY
jgi:hypothetical protein